MSSEPTYDLAMEHLEECIKALHMNAVAIVDEHWAQILEHENKARSWQEKSQLQLACHRKGNNIQIKWIGTKWYGKASSRRSVRTNIARGAGELTYSMAKLREWTSRLGSSKLLEETVTQADINPPTGTARCQSNHGTSARKACCGETPD